MKTLVFGSLNIDRTYHVDHFVQPGETMSAADMELFCGGKGLNQAVALARAGADVYLAGAVGEDGQMLLDALDRDGVHRDLVARMPCPSGHAVIQVNGAGQNCIIILPGANGRIDPAFADRVLAQFAPGDLIVLQNEISSNAYILAAAHRRGLQVAYNPSPYNEQAAQCDFALVDYLLINEVEGAAIAGSEEPDAILRILHDCYPRMNVLLTLGAAGAVYRSVDGTQYRTGSYARAVVDTTAAGDTFTGYFLAELQRSDDIQRALHIASLASGIGVSRPGALPSIPYRAEVEARCNGGL